MSAEMMFHAVADVQLPETCTLGQLREALEEIATDLMVDVAVMPARAGAQARRFSATEVPERTELQT